MTHTTLTVPPGKIPGGTVARRVDGVLAAGEDIATSLIIVVIFLLLMAQVVSRYIVGFPAFWIEEVARMGMVWLTFIGAAFVTNQMLHLAVTDLTDRLGRRARTVFAYVAELSILGTALLLIPAAWYVFEKLSAVSSSAGVMPRSVLFLGPLIGLILMAVHSLINVLWKAPAASNSEALS